MAPKASFLPRALVPFSLVVIVACAPARESETITETENDPVGREEYERLLSQGSGSQLTLDRLVELAADAEGRIETRMSRAAARLQSPPPSGDWRPIFAAASADHPATADEVLDLYRREVGLAAAYVAGLDWVSLPPTQPDVVDAQSPIVRRSFSLALYLNGALGVVTAPAAGDDPDYLANHCRICIPPLAVHEAYPGHHVAFYHAAITKNGLTLGDEVEIRGRPENFFFHEGWGLDAELALLAAGYYDDPARELAAWRMVLLRAVRARLDAQLHSGAITPAEATRVYEEDLVMPADAAATEVRRHLERPTNKATYFVGLLQIQTLRRQARKASPAMSLREFHDRLLARPRPVPHVARDEFGIEIKRLEPIELGIRRAAPVG